jgi:glutamate-1-semialdehyde aminotransferase
MIAAPEAAGQVYGQIEARADQLRSGFNSALREAGLSGRAFSYGRGSVFHVCFDLESPDGVEWPADGDIYRSEFAATLAKPAVQARLKKGIPEPLRTQLLLELDNRGVQFMGGTGGFVSTAHTENDIAETVEAFAGAVAALQKHKWL